MHKLTPVAGVALAFALAAPVAAQEADASTVVARVGETEITLGEVIIARSQLPQQYAQLPVEMLFPGLVDQLIQQQLLADALEDVPARVTYALNNERRSLMAGEVVNDLTEEAITEEALQAAYDARFANAEDVLEFNAAHLLTETEEDAAAAKARIDAGEDFAEVAREVSTGPSGPNGGDLGWFGEGAMVPAFEEAVMALEPGEVTEPFQTQFGWHVATLKETRVQAKPTLDQVRRELTAELQEAAITAKLAELEAQIEVVRPEAGEFDASLLDNFDLLDK